MLKHRTSKVFFLVQSQAKVVYGRTRLQCFFVWRRQQQNQQRIDYVYVPLLRKETLLVLVQFTPPIQGHQAPLPPQMIQAKQLSMEEWHHKALVDWVPILLLHLHLDRWLFFIQWVKCPSLVGWGLKVGKVGSLMTLCAFMDPLQLHWPLHLSETVTASYKEGVISQRCKDLN